MIKKTVLFFSMILFSVLFLSVPVSAEEAVHAGSVLTVEGFPAPSVLSDGNDRTYTTAAYGGSVTITREGGISFLYIVFDCIPGQWTLADSSGSAQSVCGENSYLHEYVDVSSKLGSTPETVRLDFPAGTSIDEIYAFGEGTVPDWVQRWSPPCEQADLLLLTAHSDDEQLFFAGVLPIYAGERGLSVQVVYFVNHFHSTTAGYEHFRPHEQLDGLWAVGVRNYPVMSDFPDLYSESLEGALEAYREVGLEYDDFTRFVTDILRRFKPLVVVSHDVDGEYGHGTHKLCAEALMDSVGLSADETSFPESAELYGTWEPEKTYFHLYPEHSITLDLDSPLPSFGGRTAFEVAQAGFEHHTSQHWTWFYGWIYGENNQTITLATDIEAFSPCYYGLYSTSVGYDVVGGDLMENVVPYAERNTEDPPPSSFEPVSSETDIIKNTEAPLPSLPPEPSPPPEEQETVGHLLPVATALAAAAVVICVIAVWPKKGESNFTGGIDEE